MNYGTEVRKILKNLYGLPYFNLIILTGHFIFNRFSGLEGISI